MSVKGVWKVEMLGPYGWESVSTAFFEDGGVYKSASQDHYAIGSYSVDGDQVAISGATHAHGDIKTLFGDKREDMELQFEGRLDGSEISGQARRADSKYTVTFRATRVGDLD